MAMAIQNFCCMYACMYVVCNDSEEYLKKSINLKENYQIF